MEELAVGVVALGREVERRRHERAMFGARRPVKQGHRGDGGGERVGEVGFAVKVRISSGGDARFAVKTPTQRGGEGGVRRESVDLVR